MKTYTPKWLTGADLRQVLGDLHATPAQAAKYLQVTERSVWRWLADGSAPFAAMAALWHATPGGRETSALDVGNELVIQRGLTRCAQDAQALADGRLVRLLAISDTGAANDPLADGLQNPNAVFVNVAVGLDFKYDHAVGSGDPKDTIPKIAL